MAVIKALIQICGMGLCIDVTLESIRNGGLDFVKAAVKLIWACQYVCCTTAFFFYRRPAVIFYIFLRTIISLYTESVDWIAIQSVYYRLSVLPD